MSDARAVTLDTISRLLRELQVDMRENRRDVEIMLPVITSLVEQGRRIERHMAELKDDLELMIRAELLGSVGHIRNHLERPLQDLGDRIGRLEGK